jgi:hypothetical protein
MANFLANAISNLSDDEAVTLFRALSEWVDREQDLMERLSSSPLGSPPRRSRELECAEGVLSKLSAEFTANAKEFWFPGHP